MEPREFKATNMVMVTTLDHKLNLASAYELLTIYAVDFEVGRKHNGSSRVKVPYFGTEGPIVSVRYNMKSRGVRKDGGQLRNVVAIDLQCGYKNIHLKISKSKIQLAGALTEEMGQEAFEWTIAHLQMINEHFLHIQSLAPETVQATEKWLLQIFNPDGADTKLLKYEDPKIQQALDSPPEGINLRMAKYLAMFAHEFQTGIEFESKIRTILTLPAAVYDQLPNLGTLVIHNGVYGDHLARRVSLINLSQQLFSQVHPSQRKKYFVSYHNWTAAKCFQVMVPIQDYNPSTQPRKKVLAHRFTIYQSGAIRQSSPSSLVAAAEIHSMLIADIRQILATTDT